MFPYDFIFEELYPLQFRHKKMFGIDAFYYGDKIVFALRQKDNHIEDNGIWIATKTEHHEELRSLIKDVRMIKVYGLKSWLLLPDDSDYFEEGARQIAKLIKQHSILIGNIPKLKKKKSS
ncbi:hypothetical protein [Aquimarina sp. AU474]|uniref:hypothetical protein n=1 Tax=Aquimarina sp. AU474 TaxID=2108529 RepID=UPI000D69AFC2|nr:hypothetical protein [Aquimarina sp. AU474]